MLVDVGVFVVEFFINFQVEVVVYQIEVGFIFDGLQIGGYVFQYYVVWVEVEGDNFFVVQMLFDIFC